MRCKKYFILCVVLIGLFIALFAFPACSMDYGKAYPSYLTQSGGSFIECQTNLGRGTIILPITYKSDYFGFSGTSYNVMNLTSSSLSGYFITSSGSQYSIYFNPFSTCQYRQDNNYYNYADLTISQIFNTNVQFIDYSGTRQNTIASFKPFEIAVIGLFTIHCCYDFLSLFVKKRA